MMDKKTPPAEIKKMVLFYEKDEKGWEFEGIINILFDCCGILKEIYGDRGIGVLFGKTAGESIPILKRGVEEVKHAKGEELLRGLLEIAEMAPQDAIWEQDSKTERRVHKYDELREILGNPMKLFPSLTMANSRKAKHEELHRLYSVDEKQIELEHAQLMYVMAVCGDYENLTLFPSDILDETLPALLVEKITDILG